MKLEKGSASSFKTYEACPARWEATYTGTRPPELPGAPAMKGTVCHYALEYFIKAMMHLTGDTFDTKLKVLTGFARYEYDRLFKSDDSHWSDCVDMLETWLRNTPREYWEDRMVLSTEKKMTFNLATNDGVKPFTYICDRVDSLTLPDGRDVIEVVDYKSYRDGTKADKMKGDLQVKAYAIAMMMEYKEQFDTPSGNTLAGITVTLDLLRHGRTSVFFSREECLDAWRDLKAMANTILADEDPQETINEECMYCVRRMACATIREHAVHGGAMSFTNMDAAADAYFYVSAIMKALKANQDDLKNQILTYCKHEDLIGFTTDATDIKLNVRVVNGKAQTPYITAKKKKGK